MRPITRRQLVHVLGGTAATLAISPRALAQRADDEIIIGQSLDLSGPQSANGRDIRAGAEARIHQVNTNGGIGGRKLVLEVLDDKFDPRQAAENAALLVKEKNAVALLGAVGNPSAAALQKFANSNKVVVVGSQAGNPVLTGSQPRYDFYVTANYRTEADYCVAQLKSMGLARIATFFPNDEMGNVVTQTAREAVGRHGASLAAAISYDRQKPDFAAAVLQLRNSQTQAVVMAAPTKTASSFIRAVNEAQLGIRIVAFSVVSMTGVQQEIQDLSAGTMFSQPLPYPRGNTSRFVQVFQRAMKEERTRLNYSHLHGYLAASVLIEGLKESTGAGSDRLVQALERSKGYDLNGYAIRYAREQREGSSFVEMVLLGRDGRIVR